MRPEHLAEVQVAVHALARGSRRQDPDLGDDGGDAVGEAGERRDGRESPREPGGDRAGDLLGPLVGGLHAVRLDECVVHRRGDRAQVRGRARRTTRPGAAYAQASSNPSSAASTNAASTPR